MNCLFRRVLRTRAPRQNEAADHRFCIRATYGYGRSRRFDPPPAKCRHARSAHFSDAYDVELAIERAHAHIVRPMRASHAPEESPDCSVPHRMPRRNPRTAPLRTACLEGILGPHRCASYAPCAYHPRRTATSAALTFLRTRLIERQLDYRFGGKGRARGIRKPKRASHKRRAAAGYRKPQARSRSGSR